MRFSQIRKNVLVTNSAGDGGDVYHALLVEVLLPLFG